MEELANLINSVARFLAFGIGGVSVIVFIYAGFLFMTASGDPQKSGQARQALMGAFIGLIVTGAAFILPRIISQAIIEPAGGVAIVTEGQVACDTLLEDQLVVQRGSNSGDRMNEVIRLIQNRSTCTADIWNPHVVSAVDWPGSPPAGAPGSIANAPGHNCIDLRSAPNTDHSVGSDELPIGLREGRQAGADPIARSFRDASNNILVIFWDSTTEANKRLPSDGSTCWLYLSRLRSWSRDYE